MYHLQMYTILTTINDDRGYSWPVGVKLAVATSVDTKPAKTQSTVKIRIPNKPAVVCSCWRTQHRSRQIIIILQSFQYTKKLPFYFSQNFCVEKKKKLKVNQLQPSHDHPIAQNAEMVLKKEGTHVKSISAPRFCKTLKGE